MLERDIQELRQMKGRQEQGGGVQAKLRKQAGEIDKLTIRLKSGNNFLIIWALSVSFAIYVAMALSSS